MFVTVFTVKDNFISRIVKVKDLAICIINVHKNKHIDIDFVNLPAKKKYTK